MLAALLCMLLCAVLVFVVRSRAMRSPHKLPPKYPGHLPFIGLAHTLQQDTTEAWLRVKKYARYCVENGGVIHVKLGTELYYLITDTQDALTASNACIRRHYGIEYTKSWLGDGLMTSYGEVWQHHRKVLYPAFTLSNIYGFLDMFNGQARKLCNELEYCAGKGPFNHIPYLTKISMEVICYSLFGLETIGDKNLMKYLKYTDDLCMIAVHRFLRFWLHIDLVYRLSGQKKKENDMVVIIDKITNKVIESRKLAIQNRAQYEDSSIKDKEMKPLLDFLLRMSSEGTLTDKDIRDEIHTMILGGYETTSNLLVHILLLLGAHPDVQQKILTEYLEVVGPDGDVMNEHPNKLVYTNAVITETLRMYPLVPILIRTVDKDVKLKNYTMRAGSHCFIMPLVDQQNPIWGSDGGTFRPERWLQNEPLMNNKEFAGFGLGKRLCVGKDFGLIIVKVLLAHFIRQYKVTADISNLQSKIDFILRPVAGHLISIEKRI